MRAGNREQVRNSGIGKGLGDSLHEFVRGKYFEFWDGLQNEPPEQ